MFIIFGDKHRTEPVPGGLVEHRQCPKCHEHATFRERVVSQQFRLYFVSMFTHGTHHVMECGACGTTFVSDEVKDKKADNDHEGTVFGTVKDAFVEGRKQVAGALDEQQVAKAKEAFGTATAHAGRFFDQMQESVGSVMSGLLATDDDSNNKKT